MSPPSGNGATANERRDVSGVSPRGSGVSPRVSGVSPRVRGQSARVSGQSARVSGQSVRVSGQIAPVSGHGARVSGLNERLRFEDHAAKVAIDFVDEAKNEWKAGAKAAAKAKAKAKASNVLNMFGHHGGASKLPIPKAPSPKAPAGALGGLKKAGLLQIHEVVIAHHERGPPSAVDEAEYDANGRRKKRAPADPKSVIRQFSRSATRRQKKKVGRPVGRGQDACLHDV